MTEVRHELHIHNANAFNGKKGYTATCSCTKWILVFTYRKNRCEKQWLEKHMAKVNKPKCPAKGKRGYKNEEEAQKVLGQFWSKCARGKIMPTRVYECVCGKWHLTSQPKRSYK